MGRPRKVAKEGNIVVQVQEGNALNPSAAPVMAPSVIGEENSDTPTGINSTVKETAGVETKVDHRSDDSQTVMITSQDSRRSTRQSDRLKRKPEPDVLFNLVECKAKEPKVQASISPIQDEVILEQELPSDDNSNDMETMNAEITVHHDSNGSLPKKKTSEETAKSGRVKTKKEHVERVSRVERKNKPSKGKQVGFVRTPAKKNLEQEAPSQVHQPVDERNLVEKVDYVSQGNTSPNDSTPIDVDYKTLYLGAEKRIEGLMEDNMDLARELNFAHGKIEAYEKMMGTMGFALHLSSQKGIPVPTNAAAPDTSNIHQNVSSPKPKLPSPTKGGRYKKKAKA